MEVGFGIVDLLDVLRLISVEMKHAYIHLKLPIISEIIKQRKNIAVP